MPLVDTPVAISVRFQHESLFEEFDKREGGNITKRRESRGEAIRTTRACNAVERAALVVVCGVK